MIELKELQFIYDGKILLDRFSATVREGEKVVLYGASGTGKSTLLAGIAGFVKPQKGEIRVDKMPMDATHIHEIRKRTAWVPQDFNLPYETVEEVMKTPFLLKNNRHIRPTETDCRRMLENLGLDSGIYTKRLAEISGGQRQRVLIAVALLLNKKIILLDEPTSALDPDSTQQIIRFLQRQQGKTIVAVSHEPHFIQAFDRHIVVGPSEQEL